MTRTVLCNVCLSEDKGEESARVPCRSRQRRFLGQCMQGTFESVIKIDGRSSMMKSEDL